MAFSKTKMFWTTGLLLAVVLTATGTAYAQWDGRLWKPYQPEQFGGSRRSADGIYGSVEAIYWKVNNLTNVDFSTKVIAFTEMESDFRLGTRITFGNRRGHHGWRASGYGIGFDSSIMQTDNWDWSRSDSYSKSFTYPRVEEVIDGVTIPQYDVVRKYTYEWVDAKSTIAHSNFQATICNLDLAYTYRVHPFSWGELELFAGGKYLEFSENLHFLNGGDHYVYVYGIWAKSPDYYYPYDDLGFSTKSIEPLVVGLENHQILQAKNRMVGPNFGFDLSRRNNRWTFAIMPSIFLGVNNQSFTFEEHGKVTGSLSNEDMSSDEYFQDILKSYIKGPLDVSELTFAQLEALSVMERELYGDLTKGATLYKRHRTVFSPGIGLQMSAKWQWTDAIGIKFGFDATVIDNVARSTTLVATPNMIEVDAIDANHKPIIGADGEKITEERRNGFNFSLRSKGETVVLYGISIGLEMRR